MTSKDKIKIGFTGILFIVFVLVLVSSLNTIRRGRRPSPVAGVIQPGQAWPGEINLYSLVEEMAKDLKVERDPFDKPKLIIREEASELTLSGIIWDKNNPKAVVNNLIVEAGDTVKGKRVIEIGRDYIVLFDGTKQYELGLGFEPVEN